MDALTRDEILKADDLPRERVKAWGRYVYVRALTGEERDAFEESMFTGRGADRVQNAQNIRARLAVLTVVDGEGRRLFGDEDAAALGAKSARELDRIFSAAQRLSGLTADDVEQLVGNSDGARGDGTSSASRADTGSR
jgi:hypothetical protein